MPGVFLWKKLVIDLLFICYIVKKNLIEKKDVALNQVDMEMSE